VLGGVLDGGDQVGPFGVQPHQRLRVVGEPDRCRRWLDEGRGQRQPQLLGVQQPRGRIGRVQVPTQ
jgi:hypothetical protein